MKAKLEGFGWLLRSSVAILIGTVLGQLFGYIAAILMTRTMGVDAFGVMTLLVAFVSTSTAIANTGVARTLSRFCALYRAQEDYRALVGTVVYLTVGVVVIATVVTLTIVLFSDEIAKTYLGSSIYARELSTVAWMIPSIVGAASLFQALRGIGSVRERVIFDSILRPVLRCAGYGLALIFACTLPLEGAVRIEVCIAAIVLIGAIYSANAKFSAFYTSGLVVHWEEVLRYTVPIIPATVLFNLAAQAPFLLIGFLGEPRDAAILGVCFKILTTGQILVQALNSNFSPMVSSYQGAGRISELGSVFSRVTRMLNLLMSVWCGLILLSGDYLLMLFGPEFTDAYGVLSISTLHLVVVGVTGPALDMVMMTGDTKTTIRAAVIMLAVAVTVAFILLPSIGVYGACIGYVGSGIATQVYAAICVQRKFGINAFSKNALVIAFVLPLLGLILHGLVRICEGSLEWWLAPALACTVFALAVVLVGIRSVSGEERMLLRGYLERAFSTRLRVN